MLEQGSVSQALDVLCRASDSELSQFVSQLKHLANRLRTPSLTWSTQLPPYLSVNNEGSRPASLSQALPAQAPKLSSDTSLAIPQKHVPPTHSNSAVNNNRQKKKKEPVEEVLTGIEASFKEIRTYLCQPEKIAVGKFIWKNEHPLVVDLQTSPAESKQSDQELFRKVLSQLELTKRYLQWENANHGSSKVEQLVRNLEHRGSGHINPYLKSHEDFRDKEAAFKGIRHGIKHLVIRELLKRSLKESRKMQDCEDVNALSAIMAFVYSRCRSIKYPDIPAFICELRSSKFNHIWQLAKERSVWFSTCQALYKGMDLPMLTIAAHSQSRDYRQHASCIKCEKAS
jgi:hypothetical protein